MCRVIPYVSHDCDAHRNKKLLKLRGTHGWRGYGLFWGLIEMLREDKEHKLPTDYRIIKVALDAPINLIKSVVEDFGLFTINGDEFYSQGLMERMQRVYNKVERDEIVEELEELEEDPEDAERKAEIRRLRSEAGRKGGQIGGKVYQPSKAKAKQKESKTDSEESKSKAKAKQKESKTASNGGTIWGEEEKEKILKAKDSPPPPPQGGEVSIGEQGGFVEDWQGEEEIAQAIARHGVGITSVEEVCTLYEKHCPNLTPLTPYDRSRISGIAHALKANGLEGLERIFVKAGQSSFLRGEVTSWRADFGWLLKPENYHKVLAGNYDNRGQTISAPRGRESVGVPMEIDKEQARKYAARVTKLE